MAEEGQRWRPDWSALLPELLTHIAESITNFVDFISYRSVCSSWRSAATPRRFPHSFPFLAQHVVDSNNSGSSFCFVSLFNGKILKSIRNTCPNSRLIGSIDGWIVVGLKYPLTSAISVINPFTGSEIHFPPLDPYTTGFTCSYIKKIVVSSPAACSRISALALLGHSKKFALARPGADSWEMVGSSFHYHDALFFRGRFHIVDAFKRVFACEEGEGGSQPPRLVEVMRCIPPIRLPFIVSGERSYLAESAGELILIILLIDASSVLETPKFKVFKMDPDDRKQWMEVNNLGGRSLFLGLNACISISATDHPECRENCIYFTNEIIPCRLISSRFIKDVAVFNLTDGSIEVLLSSEIGPSQKFFNFLCYPLWFSPSLI